MIEIIKRLLQPYPKLRQRLLLARRHFFRKRDKVLEYFPARQYRRRQVQLAALENRTFIAKFPGKDFHVIVDPQTFFANTYVQGYYEPSVVRYLRYSVQTGMVCLDIGANVGFYSLLLANKVGASGKVIAFEPTAKIFEILQQNITQNNLKNVAAEQLALYNYDGFIQFHEGPPQFDVYNTIGQINHPDAMSQSFNANRIPCMRLDSYVASHKLNQIDLIKIDVEGAELFVLQGMEQMLAENPNLIILFEFTDHTTCGFDYSARDIINWLRAKGYQLFGINSKGRLVDLQLENSDFEKWQNHMLIASNMVNNINKPNI